MRLSTPWPKMIGCLLGVESVGLLLWQHDWWHGRLLPIEWFFLGVTLVLCVLSWAVYRAREWARRVAIAFSWIAVCMLIVGIAFHAYQGIGRVPEFASELTPAARSFQIHWFMTAVGTTLCLAAPFALLACVLAHPEVARSFHGHTPNAI